jgi:RimJ/RimL family protein N-acetyltransferase
MLRLEPLDERHVPALEPVVHDPDVLRFTRIPDPPPHGFATTWIERYVEARMDGTREGFAAVDAESGMFVGLALAPHIDIEGREGELGYLVAPNARGRGVATEILRQLTQWAFEEAGLLRAYLIVDVENVASQKVADRAGYVREGVMRSLHVKDGRRSDCILYSRLPSDG